MAVQLDVAGDVFDGVFLCCPFSPRDVLGEIWDLIELVSEGFPTYFYKNLDGEHWNKGFRFCLFYKIIH